MLECRTFFLLAIMAFAGMTCAEDSGLHLVAVAPSASVDFGDYPANKIKKHTFTLTNNSNSNVVIKKIHLPCECTVAECKDKTIKPKESAVLNIELKSESISGPYTKNIYIETDIKAQKLLTLTLTGNAEPLVKIVPSPMMYMGTLIAGGKYEYTFVITPLKEDVSLQLAEAESSSLFKCELAKRKKEWILKIIVEPQSTGTVISIESEVKITAPAGWKPIKIRLTGKTIEVKQHSEGK